MTDVSLPPIDLRQIAASLSGLQLLRYMQVSGMMFMVIEWLATFPDEIEYIWRTKISFATTSYMISRYLPAIDGALVILLNFSKRGIEGNQCARYFQSSIFVTLIGIIVSEGILVRRTTALYQGHKRVIIIIHALYIILILCLIALTITTAMLTHWQMNCQPFGFTGLAVTGAVWFPVLLGLTMYQGRYFILGRSTTTGDINKVIYVDSLRFFIMITAAGIVNAVLLISIQGALGSLSQLLVRMIHSTLSCRIMLNIRRVATAGTNSEAQSSSYEMGSRSDARSRARSSMQFVGRTVARIDSA